jgi:MFS family permease
MGYDLINPGLQGQPPRQLSPNIKLLGLVSLFTATSSAMVYGLLPIFLVKVLGASISVLGLMEGTAEATNSAMRLISGTASDWFGRRKPLVTLGYVLSAANKLLFPVADSVSVVFAARLIDRFGKGIRDAPRDALLTDLTPSEIRGSGFGLRIAFYTTGFVVGPLVAIGLMILSGDNFRLVFWLSVAPALMAIVILVFTVKEIPTNRTDGRRRVRIRLSDLAGLAASFWWSISIASLLSLARFSQAFLVLKASDIGVDAAFVPMILVLTHTVYSTAAYPFGVLADHMDRRVQLGLGSAILIAADLILAGATSVVMAALGAALWGLQMAVTQGVLAASIADAAPDNLRGTAFGIYEVAIGITAFTASAAAGALWSVGGSTLAFGAGACVAGAAAVMLVFRPPKSDALQVQQSVLP